MPDDKITEAQKKIEALEELLGVKLPRDHGVVIEIKDASDLDLDKVVGGAGAFQSDEGLRARIQFDWTKATFNVNAVGYCW